MCQVVGTNDRWSLPRRSDEEIVATTKNNNKDTGFPIKPGMTDKGKNRNQNKTPGFPLTPRE